MAATFPTPFAFRLSGGAALFAQGVPTRYRVTCGIISATIFLLARAVVAGFFFCAHRNPLTYLREGRVFLERETWYCAPRIFGLSVFRLSTTAIWLRAIRRTPALPS